MTMVRVDGVPYELIASDIAVKCSSEIKQKYPENLLRLAYEIYTGGLAEEFYSLMKEIWEMIPHVANNRA